MGGEVAPTFRASLVALMPETADRIDEVARDLDLLLEQMPTPVPNGSLEERRELRSPSAERHFEEREAFAPERHCGIVGDETSRGLPMPDLLECPFRLVAGVRFASIRVVAEAVIRGVGLEPGPLFVPGHGASPPIGERARAFRRTPGPRPALLTSSRDLRAFPIGGKGPQMGLAPASTASGAMRSPRTRPSPLRPRTLGSTRSRNGGWTEPEPRDAATRARTTRGPRGGRLDSRGGSRRDRL